MEVYHFLKKTSLTGINFKDCFNATGAYQQESLKQKYDETS